MCAPSPPQPPDPKETAAASTGTNVATAIANANLGNVNQVTPDGTLTYDQTGTYTEKDPYTGLSYDVPRYTATQTLSPEQQAIADQTNGAKLNFSTIANNQSGVLQNTLSAPVDLSSSNVEKYINDHYSDDFNKQWDQNQSTLLGKLANQGIGIGSDAYSKALDDFNTSKASAWDNLYGDQRNNAVQNILTERNQPLNEITALLSGSQVSQPNYVNANEPTIPTTDTAGIINTNYQQKLAAWQQQVAQNNSILGGLFGLGAAGVYKYSDVRLKEDIRRIGMTDDGMGIYAYRYKGSSTTELGLIAQEVAEHKPGAVARMPSGFLAVNYEEALA